MPPVASFYFLLVCGDPFLFFDLVLLFFFWWEWQGAVHANVFLTTNAPWTTTSDGNAIAVAS